MRPAGVSIFKRYTEAPSAFPLQPKVSPPTVYNRCFIFPQQTCNSDRQHYPHFTVFPVLCRESIQKKPAIAVLVLDDEAKRLFTTISG
jgi:hypothetical protein